MRRSGKSFRADDRILPGPEKPDQFRAVLRQRPRQNAALADVLLPVAVGASGAQESLERGVFLRPLVVVFMPWIPVAHLYAIQIAGNGGGAFFPVA